MKQRQIGELPVSTLGLGCMGMSDSYGSADERSEGEAVATLRRALELGIDFFDTADAYGPHTNEELLGRVLRGRTEVVIATKFGYVAGSAMEQIDGTPDYVRRACEDSLRRLGRDHIDLYYQHRVDPGTPIEETVGAMSQLVTAGKVRFLGLSEASAATIRRAHAVHPITAVQSEYSLVFREVETEVLPTVRELGIGFVPFSPLGRGMLTGLSRADLSPGDVRREKHPRWSAENIEHNLALVQPLLTVAKSRGVTPAQLALAWVLHQGDDVVPIPGTKRRGRLEENAAAVDIELSPEELAELGRVVAADQLAGARHWNMAAVNL
ncbi:MAG TPA: aldo/keto reductase [Candidatus Binatia bacterium]|nr:aldo/keto reductase [Candidatus Binatia bacterium]